MKEIKETDLGITIASSVLYTKNCWNSKQAKDEYYPYITTKHDCYIYGVLKLIEEYRKANPRKKQLEITDVGSGDGLFMSFIYSLLRTEYDRDFYYRMKGIEINNLDGYYIDTQIIDAFDVPSFNSDIIYLYNPIIKEELMLKLLKHIITHLKSKSMIIFLSAGVRGDSLRKLKFIKPIILGARDSNYDLYTYTKK